MISIGWCVAAFLIGIWIGIFLAAILHASEDERR